MSLVRIAGVVLGIAALSSVAYARKKDPEFATSANDPVLRARSEEHTSELQSPCNLVCRLLLEKKNHAGRHDLPEGEGRRDPAREAPHRPPPRSSLAQERGRLLLDPGRHDRRPTGRDLAPGRVL